MYFYYAKSVQTVHEKKSLIYIYLKLWKCNATLKMQLSVKYQFHYLFNDNAADTMICTTNANYAVTHKQKSQN